MLVTDQDPGGNPWLAAMWLVTALAAMACVVLLFRQPQAAIVAGVVFGAFLLATLVTQAVAWEFKHRVDPPPRPADGD